VQKLQMKNQKNWRKMKDKLVWKIRNALYLTAFVVILFGTSMAHQHCEVKEDDQQSSEFWPPDFIPHPHLPGGGPRKPSDGDLA